MGIMDLHPQGIMDLHLQGIMDLHHQGHLRMCHHTTAKTVSLAKNMFGVMATVVSECASTIASH